MSRYLMLMSIVLILVLSAHQVLAVEAADSVITTAIIDREPVDLVEAIPIQGGTLYFFTRIIGADEATNVVHVWYREEPLMSRVELAVNSSSWRTWSAKTFAGDPPGKWRVEVQDADFQYGIL